MIEVIKLLKISHLIDLTTPKPLIPVKKLASMWLGKIQGLKLLFIIGEV